MANPQENAKAGSGSGSTPTPASSNNRKLFVGSDGRNMRQPVRTIEMSIRNFAIVLVILSFFYRFFILTGPALSVTCKLLRSGCPPVLDEKKQVIVEGWTHEYYRGLRDLFGKGFKDGFALGGGFTAFGKLLHTHLTFDFDLGSILSDALNDANC
jgi:hypothetical protein